MIKFSIIVPLYNKAPYVRKALDSIISQTFTDWECIIVDDGSTDNSAAICEEYLSTLYTLHHTPDTLHHTPYTIHLLRQPNSGVASARNNGVAASKGAYVCFLDADDWWEPTFLEEMGKLIAEYSDAGLFCTNYIYYKPGKTQIALNLPQGYIDYPKAYLEGPMPVISSAICMPRRVFDEMGGFPIGIKLGEDFLLWAKTALQYKVAYCEKPLAYYNNDVPASLRATRNLHAPEHHMLFNMQELGDRTASLQDAALQESWKALLDKLRVSGLLDYWLSEEYHDIAAKELKKVDWTKQPKSTQRQYELPIWYLRAKRRIMQIGSYCKQKIIRMITK